MAHRADASPTEIDPSAGSALVPDARSDESAPALETQGLTRRFAGGGGVEAVSITVDARERLAVVGPSGSGKTTLLRLIAGLEPPDAGTLRIAGVEATDRPPRQRGLAMAFQDQPPYPFLNVRGNLEFGLKARGAPRDERRRRVAEIAEALGLSELLDRKPETLSGGQRRRVVIGRALAVRAALTMLDEPFAGLDPPLRAALREELIAAQERLGGALILVTHDQAEAMSFGHRVGVMSANRVLQVDRPLDLYRNPRSSAVAAFIGDPGAALLEGRLRFGDTSDWARLEGLDPGAAWVFPASVWDRNEFGSAVARGGDSASTPEIPVTLALRPEHLERLSAAEASTSGADAGASARPERPTVVARVARVEPRGARVLVTLKLGAWRLRLFEAADAAPSLGDRLAIRLKLDQAHWFFGDPRATPGA